jgi:menaquinone-specific isochorismate synthase
MLTPTAMMCDAVKGALAAELTLLASHPVDADGLLCLSIPIEPLDLTVWLAAQPRFPKVYWQGRGSTTAYAGVGAAVVLEGPDLWDRLDAFGQTHPTAGLFGGLRFDPQRAVGPEWAAFGQGAFFLPTFVVEQDDRCTRLHCNLVIPPDASEAQWHARLDEALVDLVLDVPAPGLTPEVEGVAAEEGEPTRWVESVAAITGRIAAGELQKVVLARRKDVTFAAPPDPFRFIRHFKAMKSPAYYFCFQFDSGSAFVGSSPERLFERSGRQVRSEALAGTRTRGAMPTDDEALKASLLASPKDRHEHRLVHDHIRAALAPRCREVVVEELPTVLQLILVQHLLTEMAGTLVDGCADRDLVAALHPTPAVGGLPVDRALAAIRDHERFDRGWYAAPLGRVSHDHVDLTVAIRSGLLHGRRLSLYCGAGIVQDSEAESEWAETEIKFANFMHVIHAG